MNVLILSQYYYPEPITKPHELAESLQQRGHKVTVVTGFPNYPTGEFYPGYKVRPWSSETLNGVRVIRLPLFPDHSWSTWRRILNYGSFAAVASVLAPFMVGNVDVMYVWHPPLTIGVPAVILKWLRRIPFIYGVHDIWPESAVSIGMLKDNWLVTLLRKLERFIYARADVVGVVSGGFIDNIVSKGVAHSKIHLLPDWADESVYYPAPYDAELAKSNGMHGKFNVVFGGQLGAAQGLQTVIEAAELLKNDEDIQFVFVGDGGEKASLDSNAKNRGLTNVRFLGRVAPEQVRVIYGVADVLLVHLKAGFFASLSVPSKTYAYMACGKPILMAMDGSAASLIETTGAGVRCLPGNAESMADAVRKLKDMPDEQLATMGTAGQEAFMTSYRKGVVVDLHEELMAKLAKKSEG